MNRLPFSLVTLAGVLAACQVLPTIAGQSFRGSGVAGGTEIIVGFNAPGGPDAVAQAEKALSPVRGLLLANTHLFRVKDGEDANAVMERLQRHPLVSYAEPNVEVQALATPNDPEFPRLWGQVKIQAPEAWDVTTGSAAVLVADVDSGVDYAHPDLANGQIVLGPDLVNGDADPMDDNGHGTHVAGTIGATGNNAVGIAGTAYGTRILAIKVLDARGSGRLATVADGIVTAHQQGARVINLSLGTSFSSTTLKLAVDQATTAGALVVAAAGNDGSQRKFYPAAYPNAVAVAASDEQDGRATFSNDGDWVDIAAPGVNIYSTTGGAYAAWNGTSMATPHVAGTAALLLANRADLTVSHMRDLLVRNGDPTTGFRSKSEPFGRVNAFKALSAPTPSPTPVPSPTPKPGKGPNK